MNSRITNFRSLFPSLNIDAFLVTFLPHLRYLTGFSGSNGIGIVTPRSQYFLTDGRYEEQVKHEVSGWNIAIARDYNMYDIVKKKHWLRAGMNVGIDGNDITIAHYQTIKKRFPGVSFRAKKEVLNQLTSLKDEHEIALLKKAIAITDKVFADILPLLKPGVVESDIASEITFKHRRYGAESDAFEPIVASGQLGALPHARASSKKIKKGDMVTLDFGCVYKGYHSDMTRTVAVGKPSGEMKKIYHIVLNAQTKAIEMVKNGMTGKELDAIPRNYIKEAGYGEFFNHATGHGIGLQIHESPKISSLSKTKLQINNVFTIEPGIYLPGIGGVRIEDDILLRDNTCEVLNHSPKELLIL